LAVEDNIIGGLKNAQDANTLAIFQYSLNLNSVDTPTHCKELVSHSNPPFAIHSPRGGFVLNLVNVGFLLRDRIGDPNWP